MKSPRFVALAFLLAQSAAAAPKFLDKDFKAPASIAVLPLSNGSGDLNAPIQVRLLLADAVKDRGYVVQPDEQTDEVLSSKFKISDGDGLKDADAAKLGAALGVDALLFGDVLGAKSQHLVVYDNEEIELDFRLVDAKSGKLLWEERKKAWNRAIHGEAVSSAKEGLVKGALSGESLKKSLTSGGKDKAISLAKSLKKDEPPPDSPEAKAVRWALASLPRGALVGKGADGVTSKSSSVSHSETVVTEESDEDK